MSTSGRSIGVVILLLQLGMLFLYGFAGSILNEGLIGFGINSFASNGSIAANTFWFFSFTATAIFAVLGFGFLLSYYKNATWLGFGVSALIVSISLILSPAFQNFWYDVFFIGFGSNATTTLTEDHQFFDVYNEKQEINISFQNLRIALMSSISLLTMFVGVIGKLSFASVGFTTIFFSFFWNLTFYLNASIHRGSPILQLFDDYNINNVYLFGASFGITLSIVMASINSSERRYVHDSFSVIFALMGTMFVFLTFGYTGIFLNRNPNFRPIGFVNSMFALSASFLSNISFSIIFKNQIGIKNIIFGSLSGAIGIGTVGTLFDNPGACIAIGFISGLLTAIYFSFIMPILNNKSIIDANGMVGCYFLQAFLSGFVYAPITIIAMVRSGKKFFTTQGDDTINGANYSLIYFGISLGIGLASGALTGLFCRCYQLPTHHYFTSNLMFSYDYGLYDQKKKEEVKIQSGQSIKYPNQTPNE